jgi:uncharacterized protein (TIGR03435 family)
MLPAYELSIAPGGLKMRTTTRPEAPLMQSGGLPTTDRDGFPVIPEGYGGMAARISNGTHRRTYVSFPMDLLVTQFGMDFLEIGPGGALPAHIIDKSGLTGRYDFRLEYDVPEGFGANPLGGGPELMNALEKQAGLKLVKTKAPMDVLIIDSAERVPSEN